jgi:hypothetical protein
MDNATALAELKKVCHALSAEMMKIQPPIRAVEDKATRDELFAAVFRLTQELEAVKKIVRRAETRGGEATPLT